MSRSSLNLGILSSVVVDCSESSYVVLSLNIVISLTSTVVSGTSNGLVISSIDSNSWSLLSMPESSVVSDMVLAFDSLFLLFKALCLVFVTCCKIFRIFSESPSRHVYSSHSALRGF